MKGIYFFIDDVNSDRKKDVYSDPNNPEAATFIPMSSVFPLVTNAYRSAEAVNKNVKSIPCHPYP